MRTIIIVKVLAPYAVSRFRALQALGMFDLEILALGRTENIREWKVPLNTLGIRYSEVCSQGNIDKRNSGSVRRAVSMHIEKKNARVVMVTGYSPASMRVAAEWAKSNARTCILISASTYQDRPRNAFKEGIKGWWIRNHFHSGFVGGERAAAYLERLGIPRHRLWTGYNVVDNDAFCVGAEADRVQGNSLRTRLGLPERYFLYVGRFSAEKNLARMIDAYARYREKAGREGWSLVMVGSGPQEPELKARELSLGLQGVNWFGFQQIDELPYYYALASCLVLPSLSETWGLVVNEAMASGLPVLVSERCGCVPELVRQGLNGYVFDPLDNYELVRLMTLVASGGMDLKQMGEESRRIISSFSPETWARTMADCILQTVSRRGLTPR